MNQQPQYSLGSTDWKKVGIGFLIGLAGYALTQVLEIILGTNFTFTYQGMAVNASPAVWMLASSIINAARKSLDGVKQ